MEGFVVDADGKGNCGEGEDTTELAGVVRCVSDEWEMRCFNFQV